MMRNSLRTDPKFQSLRNDAAFMEILRQLDTE